jgi:glyoxylase-like metal-dependent hydrolase (beta-lactamase superfamily II)
MMLETLAVGDYQSNCYIYASETGKKGVVIDPGDEADTIIGRIEKLGLAIPYIILTHGHPDHTAALKQVREATGAKIAVHAADVSVLKDKLLHTMLGFRHTDIVPDILLSDGDIIRTDGLELKVIHTPGHTPGGICLAGEGSVFTGDTLFMTGIGRTDLPGGNAEKLLDSIHHRLLTLPDETVIYPGHGPASTIGEERRSNPFLNGQYF